MKSGLTVHEQAQIAVAAGDNRQSVRKHVQVARIGWFRRKQGREATVGSCQANVKSYEVFIDDLAAFADGCLAININPSWPILPGGHREKDRAGKSLCLAEMSYSSQRPDLFASVSIQRVITSSALGEIASLIIPYSRGDPVFAF